jgi:hypothetical protein
MFDVRKLNTKNGKLVAERINKMLEEMTERYECTVLDANVLFGMEDIIRNTINSLINDGLVVNKNYDIKCIPAIEEYSKEELCEMSEYDVYQLKNTVRIKVTPELIIKE